MSKIETIRELADVVGDSPRTVEDVVDSLVEIGNEDKVYAKHDDHQGLKGALPEDFLNLPIEEADDPQYEEHVQAVLEQANTIIPLANRTLSEDDEEEIEEDRMLRGADHTE